MMSAAPAVSESGRNHLLVINRESLTNVGTTHDKAVNFQFRQGRNAIRDFLRDRAASHAPVSVPVTPAP
jgi:hypothetical protein